MNILVIGLGSMGKRRIRLLQQNHLCNQIFGVDTNEVNCKETESIYKVKTYSELEKALHNHIDGVIISTSPLVHSKIISQLVDYHIPIFTEINLDNTHYKYTSRLKYNLFVSSTMLYREEIKYIKDRVLHCGKCSYNYHVGQYLSDWHPWQSYKDFFVNDKKSNGCRELFAIELPWILDTFGSVKEFWVLKRKISDLELDYPDSYSLLIEHKSGTVGVLQVDIVSRQSIRELTVFGEHIHLRWKGTPDSLEEYLSDNKKNITVNLYDDVIHQQGYSCNIVENAYLAELINFIEYINNFKLPLYSLEQEKEVLDLLDRIEGEL